MEPDTETARKVEFLRSPATYGANGVEIIETHYSWVFLAGNRVYKLKKPVHDSFFDFTTLAARKRNAENEVALNRRLASTIYLRTIPLTLECGGHLALGGGGVPVDYLVEMARLPEGRMLDQRIAAGLCRAADIEILARHLARFFASARPARLTPRGYLLHFLAESGAVRGEFERSGRPDLEDRAAWVTLRLRALLGARPGLFRRRLAEHRIIEGHGDLRPEHVCLGTPPLIIDCLEFQKSLRILDPADELAFLSLECARLGCAGGGKPDIEEILFRQYRHRTADTPPPELIRFYKGLRMLIRARIAIRHVPDAESAKAVPRWPRLAAAYLAIARQQLLQKNAPERCAPGRIINGRDGPRRKREARHQIGKRLEPIPNRFDPELALDS